MPTMEDVEKADRELICKWWRFFPLPKTNEEVKIMNRIAKRFKDSMKKEENNERHSKKSKR